MFGLSYTQIVSGAVLPTLNPNLQNRWIYNLGKNNPLGWPSSYICFIDLQNMHESRDRELLWVVLARVGVPSIDREYSKWFHVNQRLRQGCVLWPLLFDGLFATAINSVLVGLS